MPMRGDVIVWNCWIGGYSKLGASYVIGEQKGEQGIIPNPLYESFFSRKVGGSYKPDLVRGNIQNKKTRLLRSLVFLWRLDLSIDSSDVRDDHSLQGSLHYRDQIYVQNKSLCCSQIRRRATSLDMLPSRVR